MADDFIFNADLDLAAEAYGLDLGNDELTVNGGEQPYEPNYMSAYLTMAQGMMGASTALDQAEQIEYNAQAISDDIDVNIANAKQARQREAQREHISGNRYLAQLENSYARSGVEFSGDVANYVAQVAAVQEQGQQQRNQDLQYRIQVMKVQQANQLEQAKFDKKSMEVQAVASLASGLIPGYGQALQIASNWDQTGPTDKKNTPKRASLRRNT